MPKIYLFEISLGRKTIERSSMRKVKCPQCREESEYSTENSYRPFCSKRCKMIDLGDWAEEKFSLASEEVPDEEELEKAFMEQMRDSLH